MPIKAIFVILLSLLLPSISYATLLEPLTPSITLADRIIAADDISAITQIAGSSLLVIASDEAVGDDDNENYIQLLKQEANNHYNVHRNLLVFTGDKAGGRELDIEGLTAVNNDVYVLGSHSSKRKKIKQSRSYKKNRKKFHSSKIKDEKDRDWLYRLRLDDDGKMLNSARITLRDIIDNDEVLSSFGSIPSKENGVDIEGITAKNDWLYLGFRGPVFRGNYVPVMKLKFENPKETYQLLYVALNGRGIRGITSVADGFLILAGAVGDGDASYQLYHWNGKDVITGNDQSAADKGKMRLLGEIQPPANGKAEGITVVKEDKTHYQLLIVFDGVKTLKNVMRSFRIVKS
jgi:hypothetical protein